MQDIAFHLGRQARAHGLPMRQCPYRFGTPHADNWLNGWQTGKPTLSTRLRQAGERALDSAYDLFDRVRRA